MRVLIVITKGELGGAQTHVLELCRALRHRFELHVLVGGPAPSPLGDALEAAGVGVEQVAGLGNALSPVALLGGLWQVASRARAWGADVIHVHSAVAAALGRVAGVLSGTPVVYTVHGFAFKPEVAPVRRLCAFTAEWLLAPLTRHLICVSDAERALAGRLGLPEDRMSVISNGISDSALWAEPSSAPAAITMVARMAAPKRPELLLQALRLLATRGVALPRTEFAGSGPLLQKCRAQAAALRLDGATFPGDVGDVAARLAGAQLFVLLSDHEGQPISIIEAMRAGLPILASDIPGIRAQVTHGREGLLARNEPAAIADALQALLADPDLRARMGAAARRRYEREFSATSMGERVAAVYAACARKLPRLARG